MRPAWKTRGSTVAITTSFDVETTPIRQEYDAETNILTIELASTIKHPSLSDPSSYASERWRSPIGLTHVLRALT